MKRRLVVIDMATIFPGRGGAGGGIWTYASNLVEQIDRLVGENGSEIKFVCLVGKGTPLTLHHIRKVEVPFDTTRVLQRLFYVHCWLPFYVWKRKAVLHKVYFEVPLITPFPFLVTIHDFMENFYRHHYQSSTGKENSLKRFYFELINKTAVRKSSKILTPSKAVAKEAVALYGINKDKIEVTPLATKQFPFNNQFSRHPDDGIQLYCIAALHVHKGHLRLIDIVLYLRKVLHLNVRLYIRGHVIDNAHYQQMVDKIAANGLGESIRFVPYQSVSSISEIYAKADWVTLLSEYEGFGLPLIEAQAHGIPVICNDIPVFREVAGDSAFFVKGDQSVEQAAISLAELFASNTKREALIAAGFENVKKYNWERFGQQMWQVYSEFLEQDDAVTKKQNQKARVRAVKPVNP